MTHTAGHDETGRVGGRGGGGGLDSKSSVQTLPEGSALCSLAEGGQIG